MQVDLSLLKSERRGRCTSGAITRRLRGLIVEGNWPPGFRLPTRRELEKGLGASTATIQKAMDELIADGFIHTRGRAGTFVTERLPHLNRIGLAMPLPPNQHYPGSGFWQVLRQAAEQLRPVSGVEVQTYYDVTTSPASPSFERLCHDVECGRIGGVLGLAIDWNGARNTPLMQHSHLARAAVDAQPVPGVPRIRMEPYFDNVSADLVAQGRKRVAVVFHRDGRGDPGTDETASAWREALRRNGLIIEEHWAIPVHAATPQTAGIAARLLMDLPADRRPDALVISDDHLVEATTAALAETSVRIPEELLVYGHANFPAPPRSAVPIRWIGYDIPRVVEAGLALLRLQLAGAKTAQEPSVNPRLESSSGNGRA